MVVKMDYHLEVYGKPLIFEDAYIQVTQVSGNKDNLNAIVTVFDSENKEHTLDMRTYSFKPETDLKSDNFIKQAYDYLKTTELFKEALDA